MCWPMKFQTTKLMHHPHRLSPITYTLPLWDYKLNNNKILKAANKSISTQKQQQVQAWFSQLIREQSTDLQSCRWRWKVKDWVVVGWFSLSSGVWVWGSAGAKLIPASPWCPLSILSGGKCNPRLARSWPALQCLLSFVTSLHSFHHCKLLGLRRETLLHQDVTQPFMCVLKTTTRTGGWLWSQPCACTHARTTRLYI